MARFIPRDVLSSYASIAALNANFDDIATLLEKCVILDGEPTEVASDLSLDHYRIKNVGEAIHPLDVPNLQQVQDAISVIPKGEKGDPGSAGEGYGSRNELAAATGASNQDDAYLTEPSYEGKFIFSNSNLSAQVAADPTRTNYVAPASAPTGASGAWVRHFEQTNRISHTSEGVGAISRLIKQKLDETVSTGDITEVQDTVNAAGGRDVQVVSNRTVTSLANLLGSKFTGVGGLRIGASQGGQYQHPQHTYATEPRSSALKANLYRVFQRIRSGSGNFNIQFYGDSTVANAANGGGYAGVAGEPHILMKRMLERKGIRNNIVINNYAVGGTDFEDLNAIPNIDTVTGTTDCLIIKYGINDARSESGDITADLLAFAATVDSKLGAIRASSGYASVDNLSIVLVGPTNTFDPQHGRTNIWYERLRPVLLAAAIKHQCFFYDPYLLMPGNIGWLAGESGGMDNPYSNGQPIHPAEIIQSLWVGGLVDEMIGFSDLSIWDNDAPVALTLLNSWVSASVDGFAAPYASMDRDGWVTLGGAVKGGTPTAFQAVAQLPNAFWWPENFEIFNCATNGGNVQMRLNTSNGQIEQHTGTGNTAWISLAGIRFRSR